MSEVPVQSKVRGAHEAPEERVQASGPVVPDADTDDTQVIEGLPAATELDADPFADDLTDELAHAAPKKWVNRTTVVIGGLVLIAAGFLGGLQVQKHYGSSSTPSAASALAALRRTGGFAGGGRTGEGFGGTGRGAAGGTGAGGAGSAAGTGAGAGAAGGASGTGGVGGAAGGQTGTIKLVDGSTIYVSLPDGTVLTVKTTKSTKVTTSSTSSVGKLKEGQSVTVVGGTPGSDGSLTASSVTAGAASK